MYRSAYLIFTVTASTGLSRTVSEINSDISKNHKFSHPRVFNAPTDMVTLELGGLKKLE